MQSHPVSTSEAPDPLSGGQPVLFPEDVWEAYRARDLEEKMGQGGPHGEAVELFVMVLRALLAAQHRRAYLGWDVFIEWDPHDPRARVSPDVFFLEGKSEDLAPSIWRTWQPGCDPPRFAVEVVSERSRAKDYDVSPGKYAALGVEELVVFDLGARGPAAPADAFPLQLFRRSPKGQFLRVYKGAGPTESDVLGASLVVTDDGRHLRIARNADGTDLVPTPEEQVRIATARAEAAEARLQQLEGELARIRAGAKG